MPERAGGKGRIFLCVRRMGYSYFEVKEYEEIHFRKSLDSD